MSKAYYDPGGDIYGMWLVDIQGKMHYLRTPIRVLCIVSVDDFKNGVTYYVEAVMALEDTTIILFIFNKPVEHSYFRISGM